ncbi:MAG: S1 family peptidase [Fastidiosipilaceae bacterium]
MKRMKLFSIVLSIFLMLNTQFLFALEMDYSPEKPIDVKFDETIPVGGDSQNEALEAYDILMSSPGFDDSTGNESYPSDFGGYYIGSDNLLHVQFVGNMRDKYEAIFKESSLNVVLEEVEYSYNDLDKIAETIFENDKNVLEAYVDTQNNQAAIGLPREFPTINNELLANNLLLKEYQIDEVRPINNLSHNDSYLPYRVFNATPSTNESELWGGDLIGSGNSLFTLGATGYYQGSSAIVTCGHGLSSGSVVNYNGTRVGSVSFHRYANGMYGDFSIVKLSYTNHTIVNKAFGPTNSTSSPIRVTGSVPKAVNGQTVYSFGQSSKWKTGTVIQTNMSLRVSGITLLGMTKVQYNIPSQAGDSGGPVYVYNNGYKVCGIHGGGDGTYSHYTPFELISDKGFTVKTN